MRYERIDSERRSDDALLLTLWEKAQQASGDEAVGDMLKLMKLAFLAAYPLYRDRVKALHLQFFRWTWGPMAKEVYSTVADLTSAGLLLAEEQFVVTEEGKRLAAAFEREVLELPENATVRREVERVADEFGALSTDPILQQVYAMRCYALDYPGRHQIKAIPMGKAFTSILSEAESDERLVVPPSWDLTLELTLSRDALRNLRQGIEDTFEGRVYGWEAVGTDV
jgi:uncharacterized phage-associated protein